MKRRLILVGCVLAWGVTALLGSVELLFACGWMYYGRYAAENMRAAEDAWMAGWLVVLLLPLLLIALCGAVYATFSYKRCGGWTPDEKK